MPFRVSAALVLIVHGLNRVFWCMGTPSRYDFACLIPRFSVDKTTLIHFLKGNHPREGLDLPPCFSFTAF